MNFADQLKSQVDIVRTVGDYVRLRKAGSRYVGLCPFHTEKTPSFGVNPAIGIFICFGCGMKGDVIRFVQEIEQLTFVETLQLLADRNGIAMPARRERADPDSELRDAAFALNQAAAQIFQENLFGANGSEARQYLGKRNLNQTVAEQFGIGYSDRSGQDLLRRIGQQYSPQQLEASGLFSRRDDGSLYDRFRGRLMFPIHNESGKVIAFGGRTLRADEEPKYLNSPETSVYKKSLVLYNLHRAKEAIRKSERAVLVEGYMDVIGVYSAGVKHVVASCGTSLTQQQVRAMKRHSESIVVNFDPDAAGANAAERSIQILIDEGMHVRVLELEDGLDPDEYIKSKGAAVYSARLEKAAGYFIWLADRARKKHDMTSSEGKMQGFESLLLPAIKRISDRLERAAVASEVASYLGIDRSLVLTEFRKTPIHRQSQPSRPEHEAVPKTERILVRSLMSDQDVREILLPRLRSSTVAGRYTVWPVIQILIEVMDTGGDFSYSAIEAKLQESQRSLLSGALFADNSDEVFSTEQAEGYLRKLETDEQQLKLDTLKSRLKDAERNGDLQQALRIYEELARSERE